MTSNQVFENCQLEKSHWKFNYIVTTEYIILAKINIPSSYFTILILICLEITLKLLFDSCVKSVKFKTNWLDQIPTLLESSVDSWLRYSKITHRYAKDSPFTWFLYLKLPIDTDFIHYICQFHQSCGINAREYFKGQLHLSKACWELWLSDGQPHSDYIGQWQRALCQCMMAVLHSSQPNPQRKRQKKENVCYKTN